MAMHDQKQLGKTQSQLKENDSKFDTAAAIEKIGTTIDTFRNWLSQSWKIALLMGKGAYLISERRRLFSQLGEEVYYKISKGELTNQDLQPMIKELDKLSKKVEIEEMLIRSARFGKANKPAAPKTSTVENS